MPVMLLAKINSLLLHHFQICKYFLDAVEKSLYGWFWECPNGEKCIYRHALPPGYVLKKDKKKMEAQKEEISLVDLIERERAALGSNQTRVTLETFLAWKKRKIQEKKKREQEEEDRKRKDFKAGRQNGLSGREMFSFNPDMVDFGMDDGEEAIESYGRNEDDDDATEYKELDLNMLSLSIKEVSFIECFITKIYFKTNLPHRWIILVPWPRRTDGRK